MQPKLEPTKNYMHSHLSELPNPRINDQREFNLSIEDQDQSVKES